MFWNEFKKEIALYFLITLLLGIFAGEEKFLDWRFQIRQTLFPQQAHQTIVVIGYDWEKDEVKAITPRPYLAKLVENIAYHRPAVIALDFRLFEDDEHLDTLANVLTRLHRGGVSKIILPTELTRGANNLYGRPVSRLPNQLEEVWTGFSNLPENAYVFTPRVMLETKLPDYAFALQIATAKTGNAFENWNQEEYINYYSGVCVDNLMWTSNGEEIPIFNYVRHDDLMDGPGASQWGQLKDKIVLIGNTFLYKDGAPDIFRTPFGYLPGVAVHANILNSILKDDHLSKPGLATVSIWSLFLIMYAVGFSCSNQSWKVRVVFLFGLFLYAALAIAIFCFFDVVVPLYFPLMSAVIVYCLIDLFKFWEVWKRAREVQKREKNADNLARKVIQ